MVRALVRRGIDVRLSMRGLLPTPKLRISVLTNFYSLYQALARLPQSSVIISYYKEINIIPCFTGFFQGYQSR